MNWTKENIAKVPSFAPYLKQIAIIEVNYSSNPALCIETCKAMVEGICKTILENLGIPTEADITFSQLVTITVKNIHADNYFATEIIDVSRRLSAVAQKIAEIRNVAGFASHGQDVKTPALPMSLALLAYKASDSMAGYLLESYLEARNRRKEVRLHYDDCQVFNDYLDDEYPLIIDDMQFSSSKALYEQDYEAYKEKYYEFSPEEYSAIVT